MYIHGFIDGVLVASVVGMIILVVAAVTYSKKKQIVDKTGAAMSVARFRFRSKALRMVQINLHSAV